ncbi:MAG: hypothetical protein IRZ19_01215 [Pyrinomonas methylaliphatogenes]|nr:hypothetical protein [Pyrinomonas methylaliphatogenes]MBX5477666.1 hypothetical protein [Pyrinomonas methylaliphatogenes]
MKKTIALITKRARGSALSTRRLRRRASSSANMLYRGSDSILSEALPFEAAAPTLRLGSVGDSRLRMLRPHCGQKLASPRTVAPHARQRRDITGPDI